MVLTLQTKFRGSRLPLPFRLMVSPPSDGDPRAYLSTASAATYPLRSVRTCLQSRPMTSGINTETFVSTAQMKKKMLGF
jgi:hypothetical protein